MRWAGHPKRAGRGFVKFVKNLVWWLAVLGASVAIWVFASSAFATQLPLILVVLFVVAFATLMSVARARRRGYRSPSPPQSEGGSSRRWEWKLSGLSGPESFSITRVVATGYHPSVVIAIIGIIAGFILVPLLSFVVIGVIGDGTSGGGTSESGGSDASFLAAVFLFLGVGFLAVGIPIFVHRRRFVSRAASAIGVVRDLKSTERGSARMQSYHPVVRFQTPDGRMVEFESDTGVPENRPGRQVEVLYDPLNPEKAHIKTFFMLWCIPLVFSGLGAVFLVIGVLLMLGLFK